MALEIRPVLPSEYEVVADLCVDAYHAFLDGDHHYMAELRAVERRAHAAEVLVAVDGAVLGTITFVPDGGPLREISTPGETEFRMLAVAPAARGRGIGTQLLQRVLDDSAGRRGVVCSSLRTMRAAHRIYARLGFERAPGRDWSPVPGVELIAFAKVLGS